VFLGNITNILLKKNEQLDEKQMSSRTIHTLHSTKKTQ
jgi:hypothetical protein